MKKRIFLPLNDTIVNDLHCGDEVLLNGIIYTARDAAHKRIYESLQSNEEIPVDLDGLTFYYMGPSPTPPGKVIGAAGPTTSYRMDFYTPLLLEKGLKGMIGKGKRDQKVIDSIKENNAVYFSTIGGAGALLQNCIIKNDVIAYDDLGTEAIRKLEVRDFPATVAIDSKGNSLYDINSKKYKNYFKNKGELNNENGH